MPNRVQTAADKAAGYSLLTRFRLTSVTNETGEITQVDAAVTTNGACSWNCARAFTKFIGDARVTIQEDGFGFMRAPEGWTEVFNKMGAFRRLWGGKDSLEAIERFNEEVDPEWGNVIEDGGEP